MFKNRGLKKRELILLLVCLIMIFGILADNAIRRARHRFNRLSEEIRLNEEKLLRLKAVLGQAKELNSAYERTFSEYKEFKDSDSLLQEIENIGKIVRVNILNIQPSSARDEGLYKIYSIKIEVQDDVLPLAKFLRTLTEGLKNISLESLQIKTQGKDESPKASVLINALVFKTASDENIN